MLIEKDITDLGIEEERLEKTVLIDGSGKVLKISVEFAEDTEGASVTVETKEGEVILKVESELFPEVYYPRVNIASQKYDPGISALTEENQSRMEPFYFFGGLSVKIERDGATGAQKIIKKISVLYDA